MPSFLLITPPLTQLNTPYPATAQLKGYLQTQGYEVEQADLGVELVDAVYRSDFLSRCGLAEEYCRVVEPVMSFLRGEDDTLAPRIANRTLLPEGARFAQLADMEWSFGTAGTVDKARYLATLFVEEIADYLREHVDGHFDLIRYAEHLANFAPEFDEIYDVLSRPATVLDEEMLRLFEAHVDAVNPDIVGFSIPFPGCLYGALRCAATLMGRARDARPLVVLGGGFPTTEWRQLNERRLFQFCDYVVLDDGELPLGRIARRQAGEEVPLVRTYWCDGDVRYSTGDSENVPFADLPAPDFGGLPLDRYLTLADMANPMQRLWSSGRWNKMMVAHGCYWHRCAFCDTSLDYIARYEAPMASTVVDRMETVMAQTGVSGFHFVDEALPPKLLRDICEEIIRRRLVVSFWGNIRFEKSYTQELCDLLAEAGCVAVSGGLEVASDRLLRLMDKGVTIKQTVDVCRHFRNAGIMVHTYLMYGFPTETLQETVNALEVVRRMFDEGIVQSAFWHRYAMTCHSPSGRNPEHYGARRTDEEPHPFCNNEVDWGLPQYPGGRDSQFPDYDIEEVGRGLRFATYNYMNAVGLDQPLRSWFAIKVPKPTV